MAYKPEERKSIQDRVCNGIMNKLTLRKICEKEGMPSAETIRVWLLEDTEFSAQYARAREARADARSDYIDEIADEVKSGKLDANAARVIIDAEKWQAGKENSKRYGDKLNLDGDLSVKLDDGQIESRLAHLFGKAGIAISAGRGGEAEGEAEADHPLPGFRPSSS